MFVYHFHLSLVYHKIFQNVNGYFGQFLAISFSTAPVENRSLTNPPHDSLPTEQKTRTNRQILPTNSRTRFLLKTRTKTCILFHPAQVSMYSVLPTLRLAPRRRPTPNPTRNPMLTCPLKTSPRAGLVKWLKLVCLLFR